MNANIGLLDRLMRLELGIAVGLVMIGTALFSFGNCIDSSE